MDSTGAKRMAAIAALTPEQRERNQMKLDEAFAKIHYTMAEARRAVRAIPAFEGQRERDQPISLTLLIDGDQVQLTVWKSSGVGAAAAAAILGEQEKHWPQGGAA